MTYDPKRGWNIADTTITFPDDDGYFLYIKVPTADGETTSEFLIDKGYIVPSRDPGYFICPWGFVHPPVNGHRQFSPYWGNGKKLPEAPIDGKTYGRKNGTWVEVADKTITSSDVITEAGGYGALYNFNVTQGTSSLTSSDDWVIPSKTHWETLLNSIDTFDEVNQYWPLAGGKLKETGLLHWNNPNIGATNEYEFNAVGTGFNGNGGFGGFKTQMAFYTSSINEETNPFILEIEFDYSFVRSFGVTQKYDGLPIRLCNPSITTEGQTGIYTGNDGKEYPYKVIGGIAWLTKNLNETQYRDHSYISGYDGGTYTPISNEDWVTRGEAGEGLMCYYNDNEALGGDTNQTLADLIPTLAKKNDLTKDFQVLVAKDITPGTAQTYELILKSREALNVDSLVVECDAGTLAGCQLLIGSTAVSLDSATTFTISTTQAELTVTSNYAIAAGDLVKLVTSTGYTGTPTIIKVQLNYSKQA